MYHMTPLYITSNIMVILVAFIIFVLPIIIIIFMSKKRERNLIGWGVLGCLFGWIAVIILAFLGRKRTKKCTQCGEMSFSDATICRVCKTSL